MSKYQFIRNIYRQIDPIRATFYLIFGSLKEISCFKNLTEAFTYFNRKKFLFFDLVGAQGGGQKNLSAIGKKIGQTVIFLLLSHQLLATHNRGGEITYRRLANQTYEFTITTCTEVGSTDRDELTLFYGDGQQDTVDRVERLTIPGYPSFQKNVYIGIHTYTSPGTYIISMEDPNRNANILNIYPNSPQDSKDVVFSLKSMLVIDPFSGNGGANNSPFFEDCPCPEIACVNKPYCYNPKAYDVDGDSLSYQLVAPLGNGTEPLPIPTVYQYPNQVGGGTFIIDPISGTVCWNNPTIIGEFNFTILVKEYRYGNLIGYVYRDIQLAVIGNCQNEPPVIDEINDTCLIAGQSLTLGINASDVNQNNQLTMTATGLPFNVVNPAIFNSTPQTTPINGLFSWTTDCNHIKASPYQVLIEVNDHGNPEFSAYSFFNIKVIPPAVTGLSVMPLGNGVNISWDAASCTNAEGYRIYRTTSMDTDIGPCCGNSNPTSSGYTKIGEVLGINNTTFNDYTNLNLGIDYCYRVTALYDIGQVESCPSDTACTRLLKEVPIITNVSVLQTGISDGIDSIAWSKPSELDTLQYPGPYHYKVYRGGNMSLQNTLVGQTSPSLYFEQADTNLIPLGINTQQYANYYRVELYYTNNGTDSLVGTSNSAGSVRLTANPSDNLIQLNWSEIVPWINDKYHIYRSNSMTGNFIYIASVTNQSYTDTGLVNGANYCYYIESEGYYSAPGFVYPILNKSQIVCSSPVDNVAPCPPILDISGDCVAGINVLTWTNPNDSCADDVMTFNLYYTPIEGAPMELLETFEIGTFTYTHSNNGSGAGCYVVTAIDSVQYNNESDSSNRVCFDNCPSYWLPNVFTPNGDGFNDFFTALEPYYHIVDIEMQIFNRWGQVIFETNNPKIDWNGNHKDNGKPLPDGVYYYVCKVNTLRLSGIDPVVLTGFIHLKGQDPQSKNE